MNLHVCAKFGPDRTTDGDVYTLGKNHATYTDTHSPIDIDGSTFYGHKLEVAGWLIATWCDR